MFPKAKYLVLFLLIASLGTSIGCHDNGERHFKDLAAAKQQGMIEKGWIPQYTPSDATNFEFLYDLDAGSVYGSFNSNDLSIFREHCSPPSKPFSIPYGLSGLSADDLKSARTSSDLDNQVYTVFVCDSGNFKVVAHRSNQRVFYWSVRGYSKQ